MKDKIENTAVQFPMNVSSSMAKYFRNTEALNCYEFKSMSVYIFFLNKYYLLLG